MPENSVHGTNFKACLSSVWQTREVSGSHSIFVSTHANFWRALSFCPHDPTITADARRRVVFHVDIFLLARWLPVVVTRDLLFAHLMFICMNTIHQCLRRMLLPCYSLWTAISQHQTRNVTMHPRIGSPQYDRCHARRQHLKGSRPYPDAILWHAMPQSACSHVGASS